MEKQILPRPERNISDQPSIFRIKNQSENFKKNILFGFSYENRNSINFGLYADISISGMVTGVSYSLFLASTEDEPFTCGRTRIRFINTPFDHPFLITVVTKDRRGNRSDKWIKFEVGKDQEQKDIAESMEEYKFNGGTGILIHELHPKQIIQIYLFEKEHLKNPFQEIEKDFDKNK